MTIGRADAPRLALGADLAVDQTRTDPPAPAWRASAGHEVLSGTAFYAELARLGFEPVPTAQGIDRAKFGVEGAEAWLHPDLDGHTDTGFLVGPRALDAALHCALVFARRRLARGISIWPSIEHVAVFRPGGTPRRLALRERSATDDRVLLDLSLEDARGFELVRLEGVEIGTASWVEARTALELTRVFTSIVRACVPVRELAADTPLPALGVTSIDLVRISSYAEECLGWAPSLAEFVATPSIAGLATLYRASRPRPSDDPPLDASALSSTERQLWFLERLTNAAGSYNEGFAWRIRGSLAVDLLERALQLVQRTHTALHSYFPARDGVPERRLERRQCSLELLVTPDAPGLLQRAIEDVVCRPFDLEHAPPFRCVLLRHAAGDATLVLTVHHIVCDAWSFARVLVPELTAAYSALLEQPALALPGWEDAQHELALREPDAAYVRSAEAHFRQQFGAVPHVLDFPFDHPRPAQQTHRGACLRRPLGAVRWRAVKSLARELEVSPFVLCVAVYQVLLQRYTRQAEFCLGVPVSLRRGAADAHVFGCRVNLSVLRARVDLQSGFREHCQGVRAALVDMLRFEQLSLGDVVRAVAPVRSLSHTPLVQAVFGYRELTGADLGLGGAEVTPCFAHNRCAKFDLALALDDFGDDAEVSLEYATDLLEPSTATRLLAHFEGLLDDVVSRSDARLGALQLASETERRLIAASECGPLRPAAAARPLGLAALRMRAASEVALRTSRMSVRVDELFEAVSHVARALRAESVAVGEFVALCVPRSPEWVVAALAVLEVGAAYAPFDPVQPRARIQHGIARSGARVVVTLDAAFQLEDGEPLRILELRDHVSRGRSSSRESCWSRVSEVNPVKGLRADGFAAAGYPSEPAGGRRGRSAAHVGVDQDAGARPVYGIMTSGTTGLPRVAAVTHAGFSNLVDWYLEALQLTTADKVLLATSIGFDLTQKNLFAALAAGAELVIDDTAQLDPERLVDLIERQAVTVLNCTPSLAYALVANASARDLGKLHTLRVLVLGGEPIDAEALRVWREHPSCRVRILNSYGPTECSDVVSACELREGRGDDLGAPIPNARCRVVDVAGGVAAFGVPGELWLSGTPLGLGYLGDEPATAAKFVRDQATTWYRTGDLVRRGATGELRYLGRIDTQVKIRGYRIELAEIEAALKTLPEVHDAIVISRPDARGRAMLIGYVVPAATVREEVHGVTLSGDADRPAGACVPGQGELVARQREFANRLRERLARQLPSYMIPNLLLPIERVPRTPSGKLDRNALPAPRLSRAPGLEVARGLVARLVDACCSVLGVSVLSADADFFEHGGHSLAAIELVSRLGSELGLELRVASLFERPILRDYAAYLAAQLEAGTRSTAQPLVTELLLDDGAHASAVRAAR